jgi:hypothetical protein
MVELSGFWDYLGLFALAAVLGAVGGVAFELLQKRGRNMTGALEWPHRLQCGRYRDLGSWSSVILGAIAALAALWVFPPTAKTVTNAAGNMHTITEYDVIKVVGLSLVIGSAAGSFLSALQARALALVKAQEAETTKKVAAGQIAEVKKAAEANASHQEIAAKAEAAQRAVADSTVTGNPDFS